MVRGTGFGLLAAILLVGLNLRGSIAAVSPVLPDIRADLYMSAGMAGLLTSLPVLCFALGAPGAVWLGRRLGIYRALLAGCLVIALATTVRPYAGVWLLLVGLIQGATGSWTLAMIPLWIAAAGLAVSAMVAGRDRLVSL